MQTWQKFKPKFFAQIEILERMVQALSAGQLDAKQQRQAEQTAHKLTGSLGLFGWMVGSNRARQIELHLQEVALSTDQEREVIEAVRLLRQGIEQVEAEAGMLIPDAPSLSSDDFPRLLIVDDDLLLAEAIRLEATLWGLQVEVATDLIIARHLMAQHPPDVVILDLNFPGSSEDGLTLLQEIADQWPDVPVLVSTVRASLHDRVEVVRLGGCAFLCKPLPTQEILKAVTSVLRPTAPPTVNRVLAVGSDPMFVANLELCLGPWAVEITALAQPQQFWEVLLTNQPDLLMIDLDLPGLSGIDLCQVVRHDPQWQDLPILVVTAQADMILMQQIFAAGATDVIQKPVLEADLVKRVVSRLDRVQLPVGSV